MKKYLLFVWLLLSSACVAQAQQDSSTIWISTAGGNIYTLNVNTCSAQLYCSTGKPFLDIALTPDGNLWGNTQDTLYRIYPNGVTTPVGKIPPSAALVGLNDSTLLIDSMAYLLAVKTTNTDTRILGFISFNADGDFTWMGKDLYMVAQSYLIKIILNDDYYSIQQIDSIRLDSSAYYTPGLATAFLDTSGWRLIGLPGNIEIYSIDTLNGHYYELCNNPETDTAWGAASMVFPPTPSTSIKAISKEAVQVYVYPNPTTANIYFALKSFNGDISKMSILFYDMNGKKLNGFPMSSREKQITLENFAPGTYIIKLKYGKKCIYTSTIIKL